MTQQITYYDPIMGTFSTSISSDFEISNNDLRLNRLSQLRLLSESLPTNINNGDIRFNNNSFLYRLTMHGMNLQQNRMVPSSLLNLGQPIKANQTLVMVGPLFDGTDYHLLKNVG